MIQEKEELDFFYEQNDPWEYEKNSEDLKRKEILLSEIYENQYENVLDIGCGQGFVTNDLPGKNIYGIDISDQAIEYAKHVCEKKIIFKQGSIYEVDKLFNIQFDLIIITGVLYPQYIGDSSSLIYLLIDKILKKGGILVSVHIDNWYKAQFPYLKLKQIYYDYRQYTHNLEIYSK